MQTGFTKRLPGLKNLTYKERLAATNLDTLELWRLRTDLIVCYKIVFGLIKVDFNNFFLVLHLQITPAVMDTNYLLNSLLVTYDITLSAVVLLTHEIICHININTLT